MIGKKIKVALCLSGEPRSSMFCFPYIYESFINLGPKYEVDTYIHSWKNFRALPLYNPKQCKIDFHLSEKLKIHTIVNFPDNYGNLINIQNQVLMWHSIKAAFDLAGEDYDIYIRCRLDLIIDSKFLLNQCIFDLVNGKYNLFIPHNELDLHPNTYGKGYTDQIFICNSESKTQLSKYYTDLMTNPSQFYQKYSSPDHFYPEEALKKYLDYHKVNVIFSPLSNYRLVRNSDVNVNHQPSYNFLDQ